MASPTDVTGLLAWYEADQLTIGAGLANGAAVSSWADQSGNGSTASQAVGADQPTVVTGAVNGLPSASFDGTDDWMLAAIASTNQPITVFAVLGNSGGSRYFGTAAAAVRCGSGAQPIIYAGVTLSGSAMSSAYHYVTCVVNGASSIIRQDGVQTAAGNAGAGNPGASIALGSEGDAAQFWSGNIAELILYTGALTLTDIQTVESYLSAKYFSTPAAPVASTQAATGVGSAGATAHGQVTPSNEYTSYFFQYGPTVAYGSQTAAQFLPAGSAAQAVSGAISGLAPSTTYHYRLVAVNSAGTANGSDQTFTTAAGPAPRVFFERPRLQVLVGDRDVTERCDTITFSATDAGGFEIATLGLPSSDRPRKGTPIAIRSGLEVAWAGRTAEISDHSQHGRATKTTGYEGLRALLRDNPISMIYVDRDLTKWGAPSNQRQINLLAANFAMASSQAAADTATGNPSIVQEIDDSWTSPFEPTCEAWYDAGSLNLIAQIFYSVIASGPALVTTDQINTCADDLTNGAQGSASLYSTTGNSGYFSPAAARRYAVLQKIVTSTPAGAQGARYLTSWRNVAVYGPHGLTLRGPDPGGLYPSDVARHALAQCAGIVPGVIVDSTGYIAPHVVYQTPVPVDQIIDDMAKLMGWPWGVWDPASVFGSQPRLDFRPPPSDATAVVTKAECDQLDVTSRLGDLYNVAEVTYTDPAGVVGVAVVTLPNPALAEAGISSRTLSLNMGAGSAAAAQAFGAGALALSQVSARAAGQATLPVSVRLPYGGSKPAHLLRPGIDRLRIVDLVDGGPMFDLANVRRDVFRISRVETSVGRDGSLSTRAEIDSGTNLLETLQARLALAAGVVGAGASGG